MISLAGVLTQPATALHLVPQFPMRSRSRDHLAWRLLVTKFYAVLLLSLSTSLAQAQQRSPLADAKPIVVKGCCVLNLSEHWEIAEANSAGKMTSVPFAEAVSRPLQMPMEAEYQQDNGNLGLSITISPKRLGKDRSQANTARLTQPSLEKLAQIYKADVDKMAASMREFIPSYFVSNFEPTQLITIEGGHALLRDAHRLKQYEQYYHQVYRYWAGASSFELEIHNDIGLTDEMQALLPKIQLDP